MGRGENEQKLLRNLNNIATNYLKVDDELLEAILTEDKSIIEAQLIDKSTDGFLKGIIENNYNEFEDKLIKEIEQNNEKRLNELVKKTFRRKFEK